MQFRKIKKKQIKQKKKKIKKAKTAPQALKYSRRRNIKESFKPPSLFPSFFFSPTTNVNPTKISLKIS